MLYGRDVERDAIGGLLDDARHWRSGVLVVRGEAGIGKTALLEDARDRAADMHVLSARGVEAESELAFGALHQRIRPALGHLDQLPAPQATALRAALGLADGSGQDRFLVFAACLSLLSELAERRPVLCLVDDAHWLDAGSADALRFVARRLDAEGIVLLFAAREGSARGFEASDLPTLALTGLDSEAAVLLLTRRGGVDAAPSVRARLVEQTRGNALALVELPAALSDDQLSGAAPLPEVLPLTRELERVFLERTKRLPAETQRLLLIAAADDSEDVGVVTRAAGDPGALDAAEEAGLVSVHGRRLEFRHPLVRSAVYEAATSTERRAAHAALANALEDDDRHADRRVWHLASSTLAADDSVLSALDEAAARAQERNGHVAAARALERAADLSSTRADRGRRLTRAAVNLSLAGRDDQAIAAATSASDLVSDAMLRADLAEVHAMAAIRGGRPLDVITILVDAARGVADVDAARAIELMMYARTAVWMEGDRAMHLELARLGASITPPPEDEASMYISRSLAGFATMIDGDAAEGARLLEAVAAWGGTVDDARHIIWASFAALWIGDATRFAELADRAGSVARERGELGTLADTLGMRASRLAMSHRFDEASIAASEALELVRGLNAANLDLLPKSALAVIAAFQGRDDDARQYAEEVVERATANGLRLRASGAVFALALADMALGRWSDAVDRLESLQPESGTMDPIAVITVPDKIEAAYRAGRLDEARAAFPDYEARDGYSTERFWPPRLAACRALLAEGEEATEHFEEAVRLGGDARPLDLARIQLLYGEHLRRQRRRTDARVQLRAALAVFERLGAEPWAERARAELRASGETARKRDPSTVSELTPQELQVARYVAEGLSNKEVAAQLFLSPRTIDAHLRSVFAKLGITSRTQLARLRLDAGSAAPVAAPV